MKSNRSQTYHLILLFTWLIFLFAQTVLGQTRGIDATVADYCTLFEPAGHKKNVMVRTEAYMTVSTIGRVDGGDSYFFSPDCNNEDFFAVVEVAAADKNAVRSFGRLSPERNYIFRVRVVGKLTESVVPVFGHLGWSRAQFDVTAFERIKDVSNSLVTPDTKAEGKLTSAGKSLQSTNSRLMFHVLMRPENEYLDGLIADDFVLTDSQNREFGKNTLSKVSRDVVFGGSSGYDIISVGVDSARGVGEDYIVEGLASIQSGDRRKEIRYESVYRRLADSFLLLSTRLSKVSETNSR